ncbi:Uma2 family endonuclease [Streptomyces sp. NPDC006798]|uniref:Uma2 family endonuclease n=1 Tax=Streptomyces sp. NPDC006798 TaxID=3155462 RepID=UPI0033F5B7AC
MIDPEAERPRSRLGRFEDMFPGHRTELVEGNIVLCPLRPFHNETIMRLWMLLEPQLAAEWALVSDVAVPFTDENEFCPDLAVIPAAEERRNLSWYPADLLELAVEVVSPSSVRNDYEIKDRHYAARGIAHYLIFDPTKGELRIRRHPGPDGYRGGDTLPYGERITVGTSLGKLVFDTSVLPVDPGK